MLYKLMQYIMETCFPFEGRLYFFKGTLHLLEKLWYFARDSGRVHAASSRILRCKYVSIFLFYIYDPLPYESDVFT